MTKKRKRRKEEKRKGINCSNSKERIIRDVDDSKRVVEREKSDSTVGLLKDIEARVHMIMLLTGELLIVGRQ